MRQIFVFINFFLLISLSLLAPAMDAIANDSSSIEKCTLFLVPHPILSHKKFKLEDDEDLLRAIILRNEKKEIKQIGAEQSQLWEQEKSITHRMIFSRTNVSKVFSIEAFIEANESGTSMEKLLSIKALLLKLNFISFDEAIALVAWFKKDSEQVYLYEKILKDRILFGINLEVINLYKTRVLRAELNKVNPATRVWIQFSLNKLLIIDDFNSAFKINPIKTLFITKNNADFFGSNKILERISEIDFTEINISEELVDSILPFLFHTHYRLSVLKKMLTGKASPEVIKKITSIIFETKKHPIQPSIHDRLMKNDLSEIKVGSKNLIRKFILDNLSTIGPSMMKEIQNVDKNDEGVVPFFLRNLVKTYPNRFVEFMSELNSDIKIIALKNPNRLILPKIYLNSITGFFISINEFDEFMDILVAKNLISWQTKEEYVPRFDSPEGIEEYIIQNLTKLSAADFIRFSKMFEIHYQVLSLYINYIAQKNFFIAVEVLINAKISDQIKYDLLYQLLASNSEYKNQFTFESAHRLMKSISSRVVRSNTAKTLLQNFIQNLNHWSANEIEIIYSYILPK